MPFQSQAYTTRAFGLPGTSSRDEFAADLPMIAEGATVKAGGFLFAGTNPEKQVVGVSAGATSVRGLCLFETAQLALSAGDSLAINEGGNVTCRERGYAYATATTAATFGQNVIVNPSTGETRTMAVVYTTTANIETGAVTTTSNVPSGFIDTGWTVERGNTAGQAIEIKRI
jgi:hypothetical protein